MASPRAFPAVMHLRCFSLVSFIKFLFVSGVLQFPYSVSKRILGFILQFGFFGDS